MSEPTDRPADDDDRDTGIRLDRNGPLPELRALVSVGTLPGRSLDLTVQVGGAVVSGTAVSRTTWLRELTVRLGSADGSQPGADEVAEAFRPLIEQADVQTADQGGDPPEEITVLYLVEVSVHAPSGSGSLDYPIYQVSIDGIDGWTLGRTAAPA